ncbi:MAG: hypothetical protein IPK82_09435 [Polyangiaceae bacterium]|nr:hypothetical protein [Polyangiaceae bacterium]
MSKSILQKLVLGAVVAAMSAVLFVAACGGSASESPWPVEPDTPVLGPAGEDGKPSTTATADAGTDAPPSVEP